MPSATPTGSASWLSWAREVVAASIYCKFWFPRLPSVLWIGLFSAVLVAANAVSIKSFGTFEYWLAMVKVMTIVVFLIVGTLLVCGIFFPRVGFANYTVYGGFAPYGWKGIGLGIVMAVFSYLGLEVVGATAGEAESPAVAVPRALRRTLGVLVFFYMGGLALGWESCLGDRLASAKALSSGPSRWRESRLLPTS